MNPNLRIFFKRSAYFLVFTAIAVAAYYGITSFVDFNFSTITEYLMYGLMGLMMTLMGALILGLILRVVWTGIMNRVDTIEMCCPDKKQKGVHIVASHYNPGGESTDGFSSYFHYYLDEKGKLYLSKKVDKDGDEIERSLHHLSAQTRLELEPDHERATRIGSYSDGDNKVNEATIRIKKGELHFRGYEGWIDYGFKVSYKVGDQIKWRVKI
jgi:hypothetical protein